jgi:hypothetical protein
MSCITALLSPAAVATRQLAQAKCYEIAVSWPMEETVNRKCLSLSWVVVTDKSGKRRMEARWTGSGQSSEEAVGDFFNTP